MDNKVWFHIEDIISKKVNKNQSIRFTPYFNSEDYRWCQLLSANYKIILNEFNAFSQENAIQPYFYKEQSLHSGKWKTSPLITWNIKRKQLKQFPNTFAILQQIPGLVSASFSMLEAGGEIAAHHGDTDAHIRAHLCLYTADDIKKVVFKVDGIEKNWEEGICLLFCDAYEHSGYNHSTQNRLVMIIDVLHQEYIKDKNKICSKVLAGLMLNYISVVYAGLKHFPKIVLKILYFLFQWIFRTLIYFRIKL